MFLDISYGLPVTVLVCKRWKWDGRAVDRVLGVKLKWMKTYTVVPRVGNSCKQKLLESSTVCLGNWLGSGRAHRL